MEVKLGRESIEQVIQEMTVQEKVQLTTGGLPYGTKAIERLGIPGALLNDSMAGINFRQLFADYCSIETGEDILCSLRRGEKILAQLRKDHCIHVEELTEDEMVCYNAIRKHLNGNLDTITKVTSFPPGITLGATWNPNVVHQCAKALAREFDALGVDVILTPNVNIQRDPLGGRLFEGYSEDPFITGEMGSEFVKGIQEVGILADPKHFAANNHEKERKGINVHVSERALREIYFPGFEACVKKGNARTIMSAYNQLNGNACSSNYELLTKILRDEWGFDGMVISDWGGVYDSAAAIAAGNNLEMPQNMELSKLVDDVENGVLAIEVLDRSVRQILKTLLEMPCMKGHKYHTIDEKYSQEAAYTAVAEGTVLLKNEQILPIPKTAKVNLCGEGVRQLLECGSGSAEVLTKKSPGLYDCMKQIGAQAVHMDASMEDDFEYLIVVGKAKGQEGMDRETMLLEPEDQKYVTEILQKAKQAGKKTILILNIAGPVDVGDYEAYADAILCVFIPGCQGSRVLTDLIYGKVNPSGKLAITFPQKYQDCPSFGNFPGYNKEVWYGEGIYVGYRYYDTKMVEPRYPFGYGLSYTNFSMDPIMIKQKLFREDETVSFSVNVRNTGTIAGKEVVQVYISHENPSLQKPIKELKAFEKVSLEPGETKTVHFTLERQKFAGYDEKTHSFVVEPGMYRILVGNSSRNILSQVRIAISGYDPFGYNEQTRFATVWADEKCLALYNRYFGEKCADNLYNDLLSYTPDYPVGKAIRERVPENCYSTSEEKEKAIADFFLELGRIDLGKEK